MGFNESNTNNTKAGAWEGEIPVHYLYTYGLANEHFFRAIKDRGVFTATRCDSCDVTYVPPRIFCQRCMASIEKYFDVGSKGRIKTFTICHEDIAGRALPKPVVLAMIEIDGTNGGIVHRVDADPKNVRIGMPVAAVFKNVPEREGRIEDILCFR